MSEPERGAPAVSAAPTTTPRVAAPARRDRTPAATTLLAAIARYTRSLYRLRRGNQVHLLRAGGEAFPAMLAAIAAARRTICLETYIFEDDRTGRRFRDALVERAQAGVTVRFIYDAMGGFGMSDSFVASMRKAGIQLIEYHPVAPWQARFNLSHRDHRKIVVVDDVVGFTGGLNISDDYAAVADGGLGWHDIHCELRGPVVIDLARLFRRTWLAEGGAAYPPPPHWGDDEPLPGTISARVVDNRKLRRRGAIRRAYLTAIAAAQRTIWLENAYFLPDRGLRRALARAVDRGVEVAVIVPGRNDIKTVEYAGLYVHRKLAARGVKMLAWSGPMMHAKTAIIDGVWGCIGSYNLDARSLHYNLEVVVEVIDHEYGEVMERQFASDQAQSLALDPTAWSRLSWWRKALAWTAYRIRGWL